MVQILGKEVGPIGYGLMRFTWSPDPTPSEEAAKAMKVALNNGSVFWNGGVFYGPEDGYNSNVLLKEYFAKHPEDADKVVISIKGGNAENSHAPDGSEANIRRSIEVTNAQLGGAKTLDIYEMARIDQKTPIEVTMRAFKKLIDEGKLKGVTLSEAAASTIRRAAKILPIQGVEVEFGLFETTIFQNGVMKACADLNIPIIAYSPLGRGILTGEIQKFEDIPEGDVRRMLPTFQPGNFENNIKFANQVKAFADKKGCTPGQVALGWVVAQSGRNGNAPIIPIPGAKSEKRVAENTKLVKLTEEEVNELDAMVKGFEKKGLRYPEHLEALSFGETPEES